jgi:hypothetical protein|tara:strand:+ start:68 stop:1087 length:1020 start_codon:yes stop_codon:yes gene_type:complete
MRKMIKTLFVSIASLSLMISANAGELSVNGTAKATFNAASGTNAATGIGIQNELNFKASGELENGFTWSYSMEQDHNSTSVVNDDTAITLGLAEMGTVKICVSECGMNAKYAFSADAYGKMSDTGVSEGIVYPSDLGTTANVQYHTPELPFGTTVSFGYGQPKTDGQSGNTVGAADGDSMESYMLVTKPVDGLTLSATYYDKNDYDDGLTNENQLEEGGAYGIKYAIGNITAGYGKSYIAPQGTSIATGATTVEFYENTGWSLGYAINEALSISYTDENSEASYLTSSTAAFDIEMTSVQASYNIGGATVSVARTSYENMAYVDNVDADETILALAFAF